MPDIQPDPDALFCAAIELRSPEARAEYLASACGTDADLHRQVESLVAAHFRAGSFLDRPLTPAGPTAAWVGPEGPGTMIGPYKLIEQIGEGGMGVVFVAEQTKPVKRRVALKVIKPGMDTKQVVARFEAERQALALMDHPNIARILDAGTTEHGRPYFVMELVRGLPITDYGDRAGLAARDRLRLFAQVCRAVQHAHMKGVIHRDLKPQNVMVTLHDGTPVPKVIDFGVAKAIGQPLTDRSMYTRFTQMVGTPLYMAPEQAELSGLDVDTRADVYSLGVLLYELLTGTTPFDPETLRKAGLDEVRRMIREDEPPRPSQRLSTLTAEDRSTASGRRGLDDRRLVRLLRGDLDWVAMKALEKDRNRRYDSAGALAADVERYLADEPVEARPPSWLYRVRRSARRNKAALATAGVVAVALVAATAVSTWQAVDANAARKLADKRLTNEQDARRLADERLDNEMKARSQAATDAAIARAVNEFLQVDLLGTVSRSPQDAGESGGYPNLTVKEALERAAARIDRRFQNEPLVEAAIRTAIGEAYCSLAQPKLATGHFEKALDIRRATLGPDDPATRAALHRLGNHYAAPAVGRSDEGILILEAVAAQNARLFGPDDPATLDSLSSLASACRIAGRLERAIPLAELLLEKRIALGGPTHPETVGAMQQLAGTYLHAGARDESIALYQKVLALSEAAQKPNGRALNGYARALQAAGRLDEAEAQLRKALALNWKLNGRRERERGVALIDKILGLNLLLQERYPEAEAVAREALAILENDGHDDDWSLYHAMSLVGGALLGQKKYEEAEPFLVRGYKGIKQRQARMDAQFTPWLIQAGDRVVRYYEATNQPEKVQEWREKLSANKR